MAIDIGIDCKEDFCSGEMELSDPPVSGDYDEMGIQEPFCDDCGSGFKKEITIIQDQTISSFTDMLSNKKLKELITVIHIRSGIKHISYTEMQEKIQDIRSNCKTRRDLIEYLSSKYNEKIDFLEFRI